VCILTTNQLTKLKQLLFSQDLEDEENPNKCMECKENDPNYCEFSDICNKYGYISINTEKGNILEDLFDTIEYLDKLLREGR